jgi:hypothetical protein
MQSLPPPAVIVSAPLPPRTSSLAAVPLKVPLSVSSVVTVMPAQSAGFTFVISLFNDNVNVYEVNNNGNWYDFGFFFGVLNALGGAGSRGQEAQLSAGSGTTPRKHARHPPWMTAMPRSRPYWESPYATPTTTFPLACPCSR